jgi:hypothetical protein
MAIRAEIVRWAEIRPGDRVLDDDEILTVEHVETRGRFLNVRYAEPLGPVTYKDDGTRWPPGQLVARLLDGDQEPTH